MLLLILKNNFIKKLCFIKLYIEVIALWIKIKNGNLSSYSCVGLEYFCGIKIRIIFDLF